MASSAQAKARQAAVGGPEGGAPPQEIERLQAQVQALREQLRRARERAAESPDQAVRRLQGQVRAYRDQLRRTQRLATMGTLTAMVAHEFNNILTPVITYADLARSDPRLTDKALRKAAEGGRRATTISTAILDMARAKRQEPVEVRFCDLVDGALAVMARHPQRDAIDLSLEAPADLMLWTRPVELQQVLLNLVINARTAVLARGTPRRIDISAERSNGEVLICVADNGGGISRRHLKRIFEPFFTTSGGAGDDAQGCGLGLPLCRELIAGMGGSISVDSTPGVGSTFLLRLPQ